MHKQWPSHNSYKQTIITGIIGIVIWLSVFLAFNSDIRNGLIADISGSMPTQAIDGDVWYYTTASKLSIVSNLDMNELSSISILISNNPETEVLLKQPSATRTNIEKLWPSMNKYTFSLSSLQKWELIAVFSHNGSKEDLAVGNIELINTDQEVVNLSISNINYR